MSEKQKLRPIVQSETSGQMVNILCFLNNSVMTVDIESWSHIPFRRHPMASYWRVFQCGDVSEMLVEKPLIGQTLIVPI